MKAESPIIHVAFCCDRGMLPGLHAAIASLLAHQSLQVVLWLNLQGLSRREVQLVKKTAAKAQEIHELEIDISPCSRFRGLHGNQTAYARLFLPENVSCRRLIYLDSDTLCLADLRTLWDADLKGHPAGMVPFGTLGTKGEWQIYKQVGLSPSNFQFNTGVILFDVDRWVAMDATAQCLHFGEKFPDQLHTADQTCINGGINTHIVSLDPTWNTPCNPGKRIQTPPQAAIYHCIGSPKPWDVLAFLIHKNFFFYYKWLNKSAAPWLLFRNHFCPESWSRLRKLWPAYVANRPF